MHINVRKSRPVVVNIQFRRILASAYVYIKINVYNL